MKHPFWLIELNGLLAQFSYLGLDDVRQMNSDDLWGVYRFLKRMRDGQA